ncbi:thiamine pyrophosphate-binding protein [Bacteriovorax sp. PP10]|uniref:Thiamine pyrophosphate-binding protein n=1 Tax=Bacteriovorax antarcticus TaxID=3088717 RepID=A0ABU5VX31_9BACT|nr:thiamine pyrophosphate-binding protein [Bacteriovorax sp. PP10]MEA9357618.1 thiamine pyrophosphate-binding protein [Bacteriovorax sp. PP10]
MLVKDYICRYLEELECQHVFGVSGANIEDLYSAIFKSKKVSVVLSKNEYNAGMMAIGSYISSKSVRAVLTTSGAGVLNTIPILAEGYSSKLPFVLISGTVPQNLEGKGAFQDTSGAGDTFDLSKMLDPCTHSVFNIREASEIPKAIIQAFARAKKSKRPTAVLIPKNIFNMEIPSHIMKEVHKEDVVEEWPLNFELAREFISRVLINKNESPLIILGEDLIHLKDLRNIQLFAKNLNGKIALTPVAKGFYDHLDSDFLGLTGVMGHDDVNAHLKTCHDVIVIGSKMDMLSRFSMEADFENKKVLHFNSEIQRSNLKSMERIEVLGDIEKNIFKLYQDFGFHNDFPAPAHTRHELEHTHHHHIDYTSAIALIGNELESDADVFVDAGNSGAFVIHDLKVRGEGLFYVSLGMGGMGNSIGASIGSAIESKKKTYVFLGDGSFLMHGLEIHTAIQHSLPMVFFIFNNNSHGMCSTRESIFLDGETGVNNFRPCYFGQGFDRIFPEVQSFEVNTMEELRFTMLKTKHPSMPCIVSINIDNHAKPPFRTFNK